MKCTKCGLRDATTEVLHSYNGHIEKIYLCNECAKTSGADMAFDELKFLSKLIGSPMGLVGSFDEASNTPKNHNAMCPDCKTTSEQFLETGFVGCPRCYEVFEPLIRQTVKKLQQADMHIGKSPYAAVNTDAEEAKLKGELQAAIDSGDYTMVIELSKRLEQLRAERSQRGEKL